MALYWPIALVVGANIFYHICTKSTPERLDPFAALTVTYIVGAIISTVCYYLFNPGTNILDQAQHVNWVPFVLGTAIVALEAGNIYMYKAGWNINTGALVASVLLAIALVFVGFLLYKEAITMNKVIGVVICLVGLYFLNK